MMTGITLRWITKPLPASSVRQMQVNGRDNIQDRVPIRGNIHQLVNLK
jgi:hypothetical protein